MDSTLRLITCTINDEKKEIIDIVRRITEKHMFDWKGKNRQDSEDSCGEVFESEKEQKLASSLKGEMDKILGGNWTTICGERFSLSVGILKSDYFLHFKIKDINIMIFKYKFE